MKSKYLGRYVLYTIVGFLILATGAVLAKSLRDTTGVLNSLPYIFIGIGAGIFGQNISNVVKILLLKNSPEAAEQIEIEETDERNVMIRNKAMAKAYQLMLFVYGALMMAFGLMKVDITIVITMVVAYLFVVFASIYFRAQIEKDL